MAVPEDLSNVEGAFRSNVINFSLTRYSDSEITPSNHYSRNLEITEFVNDILPEVERRINAFKRNYGLKGKV